MPITDLDIYSRRSQEVVMVLYALRALGSIHSKEEVLRYIRASQFYAFQPGDKGLYESKREWKSDTLLCYARKDAVQNGWMFNHDEKDSWQIDREGLNALEEIRTLFSRQRWDIHRCYMWRPQFKKIIDPTYSPSTRDQQRPRRRMTPLEQALELLLRLQSSEKKPPNP